MGKGDKRSKKGKIINKSYGKSRPRKSKIAQSKKAK
jgi:ribosomal small subunit protein bTHX